MGLARFPAGPRAADGAIAGAPRAAVRARGATPRVAGERRWRQRATPMRCTAEVATGVSGGHPAAASRYNRYESACVLSHMSGEVSTFLMAVPDSYVVSAIDQQLSPESLLRRRRERASRYGAGHG